MIRATFALANLWLSPAHQMGVPLERFADSTGALTAYAGEPAP